VGDSRQVVRMKLLEGVRGGRSGVMSWRWKAGWCANWLEQATRSMLGRPGDQVSGGTRLCVESAPRRSSADGNDGLTLLDHLAVFLWIADQLQPFASRCCDMMMKSMIIRAVERCLPLWPIDAL
jgi:hypothetical protein